MDVSLHGLLTFFCYRCWQGRARARSGKATEHGRRCVGDNEDRAAKYRLSDGRDAREILNELDAVARGEAEPRGKPTLAQSLAQVITAALTNKRTGAVAIASEQLTKGLMQDDIEILLRTSRELWGDVPSLPAHLADPRAVWQGEVAGSVRQITGFVESYFQGIRLVAGLRLDVRDAESIAEEFLSRAHSLAHWQGDGDPVHPIERARDEVLAGVPARYRAKVVEKILDLEERRAAPEDVEALQAARDDRRQDALKMLTGKKVPRAR